MAKTYSIDGVAYPKDDANIHTFAKAVISEIGETLGRFGVDVLGRKCFDAIGPRAVIGKKDVSVYDDANILIDAMECPFGLRYTEGDRAGLVVKALDYGFDIVVPTIDLSDADESVITAQDELVVRLLKSVRNEFGDRFCINTISEADGDLISDDF